MTAAISATVAAQHSTVDRGRDIYARLCASCHGSGGTGFGVASWALKTRPPDLTRFSDPVTPFPRDRIRNTVSGHVRAQPSHGKSEMPRWGATLETARTPGDASELDALLAYLEDIQLRPYGPYAGPTREQVAASGKPLFAAHCAACHGEDGRGREPSGYVVGITPPDLTTFAARRPPPFAIGLLYEVIARGHDPQQPHLHAWRESFTRAGWSAPLSAKHVEALTTYVASIQRR